jgi:cytochrome c oxidase subunit 2
VGEYHIFCDQYCGQGHAAMVGKCYVLSQEDYREWSLEKAEGSAALEGRKLFLKLGCLTCHSNNSEARAPVLEGIYGSRVPLQGGRYANVDEGYIRESILNPRAKIHEGWTPIMPTYKGQVSEEDLWKVISYIKSLNRGDTPKRTDEFPAPIGAPQEMKAPSLGDPKKEEKKDDPKDEKKGSEKK